MAAAAAVEIEAGPEAVADAFGFVEILPADFEEDFFVGGETWKWAVLLRRARPARRDPSVRRPKVNTKCRQ